MIRIRVIVIAVLLAAVTVGAVVTVTSMADTFGRLVTDRTTVVN